MACERGRTTDVDGPPRGKCGPSLAVVSPRATIFGLANADPLRLQCPHLRGRQHLRLRLANGGAARATARNYSLPANMPPLAQHRATCVQGA
jgi:hypothetical protein